MTPEEIQALREKHHNDGHDCCAFCTDGYVWAADYPCDVIKVLDATEYPPEGQNVECDSDFHEVPVGDLPGFVYCPKCGEKL